MAEKSLRFTLFGDDRTASKTFDQVGDSAEHAHGRVSGAFKAIGIAGAGVATGAVAGAGALAVFGIKSAASLETTKTAFTGLLGSASAAQTTMTQLQQFAASTPFEFSDVAGYAQQFLAVHDSIGMTQQQMIPFLTSVGNLGAATGASTDNIHNAIMAIGQMGSAGKVTMENLNQVSEAFPGFNGAAAIASATGQTTADVMKQISAGTVSAAAAVPALVKGMQQFQGASGAMARQSQTLNGLFSTFTDTVKIKMTNAFDGLIPVVKGALPQVTNVVGATLGRLAPTIANFFQGLLPVLMPLINMLGRVMGSVLNALGPALSALAPVIVPLGAAFVSLVNAIAPLLTMAARFVAQVGGPLFDALNSIFDALGPVISALSDALAPVFPILGRAITQVMTALRPLIDALAGAFIQVIEALAPSLPDIANALASLAVNVAKILVALTPLIPVIASFLALVVRLGSDVLVTLLNVLAKVAGWVASLVVPAMKLLLTVFLDVASGILHGAASAFGWIPGIGDKLKGARDAFDRFKTQVTASLNQIPGKVNTSINVKSNADTVVPHVRQVLNELDGKKVYTTVYVGAVGSNGAGAKALNSGYTPGTNAEGTSYWRGGLTWVGEDGPELVDLPQGAGIIQNNRIPKQPIGSGSATPQVLSSGRGGDVHIQIDVHVAGSVVAEREITDAVTAGIDAVRSRRGLPSVLTR